MKDVWQIDMVGRTSSERTGYATQKPEKLLERVIMACSNEGDLCADFFSGSGTLGSVCEKTGRNWIMCDGGGLAAADQISRMGKLGSSFKFEIEEGSDNVNRIDAVYDGSSIMLEKYDPAIPKGMEKFEEELEKYRAEDSLSFVKCWSIDAGHDGDVDRASCVFDGKQRECTLEQGGCGDTVKVFGYDVFGDRFAETIEL